MPVGHLIHGTATSPPISSRELQEWAAFERVSGPILLHERLEISNALVAMTIAGMLGDGRKLDLADFVPRWDEEATPETDNSEQIVAFLRSLEAKQKESHG